MKMSGQAHTPATSPSEKSPSTNLIESWVGPRACIDILKKGKLCCCCQELNPRSSSSQPSHYNNYQSQLLGRFITKINMLATKPIVRCHSAGTELISREPLLSGR